jgi:hypothetical protein
VIVLRWLLRAGRIAVLLSGLVAAPTLLLAQFHSGLASAMDALMMRAFPHSAGTVFGQQQRRATRVDQQAARDRSLRRQAAMKARASASRRGQRLLQRGAGAMAVGWIPVLGVTADIVALEEDYRDLCALFRIIDDLTPDLDAETEGLYRQNYCHLPGEGLEYARSLAQPSPAPGMPPAYNATPNANARPLPEPP